MKPNDKAIEAARKAYCEAAVSPMEMALEAAYAAQFQSAESKALKKAWICYRLCEGGGAYDGPFFVKYEPEEGDYDKIEPILYYDAAQFPPSEDYAGLVKELRDWDFCWPSYSIEYAVPKAADALEAVLAERDALMAVNAEFSVVFKERDAAIAERDALKAELAQALDLLEEAEKHLVDYTEESEAVDARIKSFCAKHRNVGDEQKSDRAGQEKQRDCAQHNDK